MGAGASWNTVQRQRFPVADVDDVLEEVRAALRERGRTKTQWEVGSCAPAGLVDALLERGLVVRRDPYAVALILTDEPPPGPPNAVARRVETFEDFVAACEVQWEAFESSPEEIEEARALLESRWRESPIVRHAVWLDGELVCTGTAAPTPHGLLLYGRRDAPPRPRSRRLPRARPCPLGRRGSRGSPALITQGGSMSRPILERLGFEPVGHVHMLVDDFGRSGGVRSATERSHQRANAARLPAPCGGDAPDDLADAVE